MAPAAQLSSQGALRTFGFEYVTVNERAEVIARQSGVAECFDESLPNGVVLELIALSGGRYSMGSTPGPGYDDERPQHQVSVSPFFLGRYPVTQAQWQAVMGHLPPCRTLGPNRPVDRVSWHDATTFCQRLSKLTGRAYRLPSECEWEYGCRAGTAGPFYFGPTLSTELANYVGIYTYRDEPQGIYRHNSTDVGGFPANAFGLYDMHGNVWEWCADAWHSDYVGAPADGSAWQAGGAVARVLRGGCWHDPPNLCRSSARLRSLADQGEDYFGLRVALSDLTPQGSRAASRLARWQLAGRVAARVASRLAVALLRRGH